MGRRQTNVWLLTWGETWTKKRRKDCLETTKNWWGPRILRGEFNKKQDVGVLGGWSAARKYSYRMSSRASRQTESNCGHVRERDSTHFALPSQHHCCMFLPCLLRFRSSFENNTFKFIVSGSFYSLKNRWYHCSSALSKAARWPGLEGERQVGKKE